MRQTVWLLIPTLLTCGAAVARAQAPAAPQPLAAQPLSARAPEVRVVEQDGLLVQETRRIERTPVAELKTESQQVTRYVEQLTTEFRDVPQTYYVPIVEYRLEPRVYGRWNPFVEPWATYERVPYTRYELRTQTVRQPVVQRKVTPQTEVVQTPVRRLKFVDEEKISRVVLGPANRDGGMLARSAPSTGQAAPPPTAPAYGSTYGQPYSQPALTSRPPVLPPGATSGYSIGSPTDPRGELRIGGISRFDAPPGSGSRF